MIIAVVVSHYFSGCIMRLNMLDPHTIIKYNILIKTTWVAIVTVVNITVCYLFYPYYI